MFDAARTVHEVTAPTPSNHELDLARCELRRIGRPGNTRNIYVIPDYQIRIKPDGDWHRRGGIQHETACGERIDTVGGGHHSRAFTLDDKLCTSCFTKHELELGQQTAQRAKTKSAHPDGGELVARPRTMTPKGSQKIPKP